MKEALAKAQDASVDEDERLTALDDLEMVKFPSSPSHHTLRHSYLCRTTVVFVSLLSFLTSDNLLLPF